MKNKSIRVKMQAIYVTLSIIALMVVLIVVQAFVLASHKRDVVFYKSAYETSEDKKEEFAADNIKLQEQINQIQTELDGLKQTTVGSTGNKDSSTSTTEDSNEKAKDIEEINKKLAASEKKVVQLEKLKDLLQQYDSVLNELNTLATNEENALSEGDAELAGTYSAQYDAKYTTFNQIYEEIKQVLEDYKNGQY